LVIRRLCEGAELLTIRIGSVAVVSRGVVSKRQLIAILIDAENTWLIGAAFWNRQRWTPHGSCL